MPNSASVPRRSRQIACWSLASFETVSLIRTSCSEGVRPSGLRSVMPSRTWALIPATRTMKNSSRLLAEIDRNRTRSRAGWPGLTDSSSTRRLKCSQESSRLMKRSGLLLIAGGLPAPVSFSGFTMAWVDSMKLQSISSQAARDSTDRGISRRRFNDIDVRLESPVKVGEARSGAAANHLCPDAPGAGPPLPQGFGVKKLARPPYGGIGTLQTGGEIAHHAFVDGKLAIGAELDDQATKQLIVGRQ